MGNLPREPKLLRRLIVRLTLGKILVFLMSILIVVMGVTLPALSQNISNRQPPVPIYQSANDWLYLYQSDLLIDKEMIAMAYTNALIGERWGLQKIRYNNGESITVNHSDRYTLEFMPDSKINIRADCNRARGRYTLKGNQLIISIGPMTRAACAPDSIADRYLRNLEATESYWLQDGELSINLRDNLGTMKFVSILDRRT